ncbi:MAG: 2-phospho-L-lactate transferase [Candidatus Nanopelagicales bacterium]|nr:2-phospho-L-lactate transferase [Candidatus Nanopelagicales bacterium]
MRITALAGGIGGSRFIRGLLTQLATTHPDGSGGTTAEVTVIGNTGDDIWVHGLRVCPDLDTVMYTLGGGISAERGWGREGETFTAKAELASYGVEPSWFGLGDKDIATHLVRTASLAAGYSLSEVTKALCARWKPGVALLPMSDDRAETHVIVDDPSGAKDESGRPMQIAIHFQEWWIKYRAALPAHSFAIIGIDTAKPAPGVIDAIENADLIIFPPSNPVVSIGTILAVSGIAAAIRSAPAPVIGVSPIVGGAPVRGMADSCLQAIGVETSAAAVAAHYGARSEGGLIDAWLVDELDADVVDQVSALGISCRAVPLLMTDVAATAQMAAECMQAVNS